MSMEITIKELADELGVSKPTVSKAIDALGIQAELRKVGNRFMLSESQAMAVKLQITQNGESETAKKTQEILQAKSKKLQNETKKSQESEKNENDQTFQFLQLQLDILARQLEEKDKQLTEKDRQIAEKDIQISEKDKQLAAKDVQLTNAYSSLENTTAALTAAQALHAGTIHERLTEHSGIFEEDTIATREFEEDAVQNNKKPSLKQRFKYLFLGR